MLETRFNTLDNKYSEITPEILKLTELCLENSSIDIEMYTKYQVNRGLRDVNGNGVLTGLTEISEIQSFNIVDGVKIPCEGKLYYRGIDIESFVRSEEVLILRPLWMALFRKKGLDLKRQLIC